MPQDYSLALFKCDEILDSGQPPEAVKGDMYVLNLLST